MRGRAPLAVAVVVAIVLAAVLVQRGRADQVGSPFELAQEGRPLAVVQTADARATVDVAVGDVCAPGTEDVVVRDVRLLGVDGSLELTGFDPATITSRCDSDAPQSFSVELRRLDGEAAHADGVEVTYEADGELGRARLASPVTVCRQLSEC